MIQSLDRGLRLLEILDFYRGGLGLAHLADMLGLHPATTHHLVRTLVARGYVRQDSTTRKYRLGGAVLQLASGFVEQLELSRVALPYLRALHDAWRENVHLSIRDGNDVVTLLRLDSVQAVLLHEHIGDRSVAHCTASGKILLSECSRGQIEAFARQTGLPRMTSQTICDLPSLVAELERVARLGYAVDRGEYDESLICAAAPVRDYSGRVAAALSLAIPVYRFSESLLPEASIALRSTAADISAALGWREQLAHAHPDLTALRRPRKAISPAP
jgi:IclR family acetate operon transcriptional repressor